MLNLDHDYENLSNEQERISYLDELGEELIYNNYKSVLNIAGTTELSYDHFDAHNLGVL